MSKQDAMTTCYDFVMLQFCGDIGSDEWVNVMVIIREQGTMNVQWRMSAGRALALWPCMDMETFDSLMAGIANRLADVVSRWRPQKDYPTSGILKRVVSMPQNNWRWTDIRSGVTCNLKETLIDLEQHYLRGER